ncbi:MAG TPA: hypothetical protein VF456_16060 [Vicinamibacterales bacterium]
MSRRTIVALTVLAVVAVGLLFGSQQLWNALLLMHGHRPHQ